MTGVMQVDLGDLDVPEETSVQLELVSLSQRHTVKVLGRIPDTSLIVSCPSLNGQNIFIRDKQAVNVRLMLGTHVCAFSSLVAKSYLEPAPHLHIAYPNSVEASEVRETVRTETRLISNIEPDKSSSSISGAASGIIIDLSLGGAKLISKDDFGLTNETMTMVCNVRVGSYTHILRLNCEIRSQEIQMLEQVQSSMIDNDFLSRMNVEYFYVYGVRFMDLDKEAGIPLTAFVLDKLHNKNKSKS